MRKLSFIYIVLLAIVISVAGGWAQNDPFTPVNLGEPITSISLDPSDSSYLEQYRTMPDSARVARAWRHTVGRNSYTHPNPDSVEPGDELLTPLGTWCYAESGGRNSMWRAAELFVATIVNPYFNGTLPGPVVAEPERAEDVVVTDSETPLWAYFAIAGIIIGLLLFSWYLSRDREKTEEMCKEAREKLERNRKFVPDPPDFKTAATDEVNRNAQGAVQSIFGRGVEIVGDIERGCITGEQVMFNADGSSSKETFSNEPGYRATVRFPDGNERVVVCRWSCFNPCYSASDSEFKGTFMPEGSDTAEAIPVLLPDQVTTVEDSIKDSDKVASADDLPETRGADSKASDVPEEEPVESDGKLHFTKLQVSRDKGMTAEGTDIALTTDELNGILYQITGRHPDDLNKDDDTDSSASK